MANRWQTDDVDTESPTRNIHPRGCYDAESYTLLFEAGFSPQTFSLLT